MKGSGSIMWWDLGKVVPMVMQRRMEEDRRSPYSVRQEVWGLGHVRQVLFITWKSLL